MSDNEKLTGKALDERAAELDIEGRGSMTADEKRDAIAQVETAAIRDVPDEGRTSPHGPFGFIAGPE